MNYLTYIDYNTKQLDTNLKKKRKTATENQTQNGPRIHEKSKQTNTKVETSDTCFG
jgi:hypothetical protein